VSSQPKGWEYDDGVTPEHSTVSLCRVRRLYLLLMAHSRLVSRDAWGRAYNRG